ncbi:MAG: zinc ribbon domain-containing protein [Acholeplasmatales bacterium]|jgi:hypothetical protein|nr:zinc ribbon domain-containing protein [Acholeplasmatales bacterium]
MKFCEKCGNEIQNDDATFCGKCGNRVGALKCKNCGASISKDDLFCISCGQKVDENKVEEKAVVSKKVPRSNSDKEKTKKLIFWIISIFVVSLSLLFVFISIFSNWISYSNQVIDEYREGVIIEYNLYNQFIESFDTVTNKGTGIINSISTIAKISTEIGKNATGEFGSSVYILVPYIIIFISQFSLLVLLIVSLIYFIIAAVKKRSFSKVIIKLTTAFIVIYIFSIITIGSVAAFPVLALVTCAISVITIKVFNYLSQENRIPIKKLIPNIIGTAVIVISVLFLNGLSKISYPYFGVYKIIISGILKFPYFAEEITRYGYGDLYIKGTAYIVANLISFITTIVMLCVFIPARISNTLQKVKISTKVLGWISIVLLLMLSITNLMLGSFMYKDLGLKLTYGFTVVVLVLILVTQVVDCIKVPNQDAVSKLN